MTMRLATLILGCLVSPTLAEEPGPQLKPDYYLGAYRQISAQHVDQIAAMKGLADQLWAEGQELRAEVADLKKRLAEAEKGKPPYPIDPDISD